MNQISSRYDLSVIIPLDDDHGFGEPCVDSWNKQTHPRSRVQLVIVDPGNRRELVRRVRPRLAPHDIVVTVPSDNEGWLYERSNSPTVWDVIVTLRDAARGQIVWRTQLQDQEAPDIADRYIGGLDLWSRRGDFAPGTARMLGGSLFQSICADLFRPGGFRKTKHGLAALPRLA